MDLHIHQQQGLRGKLKIPGDKSISHRSIILGSLGSGLSKVSGLLESEDCLATIEAFRQMGVEIRKLQPREYQISGVGLYGLKEPQDVINCGNSGTTMRLLSGLLAAQNFYSVLTGDESLRSRPMGRVIEPLTQMGAVIWSRKHGKAPLSIQGSELQGIKYTLPVASAQVKSAILLAGLYSKGEIHIEEPGFSRDHTEQMLTGLGVELRKVDKKVVIPYQAERFLSPLNIQVPGDISSAAFFIVAGLTVDNSEIYVKDVGLNETRTGILKVVEQMGGDIQLIQHCEVGGELIGDLLVRSSQLQGIEIGGEMIPTLIDELPVIALLASQAEGETIIKDASELRVKETDRITAIVSQLAKLGVDITELPDGMVIRGPNKLRGGIRVNSFGDHRIAMTLAIAGLLAESGVIIENSESISTSFPQFTELLNQLIR